MIQPHHDKLSAIFTAALDLPPKERGPYLDRACAGMPGLREEVESLLAHDGDAASILDRIAPSRTLAALPERIGPYHVLEKIGEGGMGVVYRAEQRLPVHRQVAVKRVRAGFETQQALARFELECQNVARMEHPNIARMIDAGKHRGWAARTSRWSTSLASRSCSTAIAATCRSTPVSRCSSRCARACSTPIGTA